MNVFNNGKLESGSPREAQQFLQIMYKRSGFHEVAMDLVRVTERSSAPPCWKINSFLSEISVCLSCTKKIIKIERAFFVILRASLATRRSFQLLPQQTSNLIHNWQLQMQDGIFQDLPLLTVALIHQLYVDINVY